MAFVVDLVAVWDGADVDLVCPAVGHDFRFAWAGLELAVAVSGAVESCPHPAAIGKWLCISLEPSKFGPVCLHVSNRTDLT